MEELLRPEPLAGGVLPEQRVVVCGLSWQRYLALDRALGDNRAGPRCYYLDGDLEIMTTSHEHERIKEWIGGFLEDYFLAEGIEVIPRGQATMREAFKRAGAEPDKSWCVGEEKEPPDLVLEVALTGGGVNKLAIYARLQVPEVWIWHQNELEIYVLKSGAGAYDSVARSRLLPDLDPKLIERCLNSASWQQARRAFQAAIGKA